MAVNTRADSIEVISGCGEIVFTLGRFEDIDGVSIFGFNLGDDTVATPLLYRGDQRPPVGEARPETSETIALGFDWSPSNVSGLEVSATYFKTQFVDRFGSSDSTGGFGALTDLVLFDEFFVFDSTPQDVVNLIGDNPIAFDALGLDTNDPALIAAGVDAILDIRKRDLARSEVDGFDLTVSHVGTIGEYQTNASLNASYILDSIQQTTSASPEITIVDVVTQPLDLRPRGVVGFGRNDWSANAVVTYVDDTQNRFASEQTSVDSWTTLDINASYTFRRSTNDVFGGMTVGIGINNVF